jgi:hypothetical protein
VNTEFISTPSLVISPKGTGGSVVLATQLNERDLTERDEAGFTQEWAWALAV